MSPILQVNELFKRFGGIVVADGLNLELEGGTILGIIGPNGAGKSTLFNMICGFTKPDAGEIWLVDQEISRTPIHKRARAGIARTWQHTRLFPSLSVHDNLILGVRSYRGETIYSALFRPPSLRRQMRDLTNMADQVLERVGLTQKRNDAVGSLSYGQHKLIALGRALMNDGPLLLLDEPMAGVDGRNYTVLVSVIRDEAARGRAVCVIEHNMTFMRDIANELVFLFNGRVEAKGPTAIILEDKTLRRIYFGGDIK